MQQLYIGWRIKGFKKFYELGLKFKLSPEAEFRLSVIAYYFNKGGKNARKTANCFNLHRNTVRNWLKLFDPNDLSKLEPKARIPYNRNKRQRISQTVIDRIIYWKKLYPYLGKDKIAVILTREDNIIVSSSTIGRVFKKHKLTYLWHKPESACNYKKTIKKRNPKKRPPKIYSNKKPGKWIQVDTVTIQHLGKKVYIVTAVDLATRLAVAKAYPTPSSANAKAFLNILKLFFPGKFKIKMIHTDNGSEFAKYFDLECKNSLIEHTYSYARTPKMHAYIESFNNTIQRECLLKTDVHLPLPALNRKIVDYLITYNSFRPHKNLGYKTPLQVYCNYWNNSTKVHTMLWTHSIKWFTLTLGCKYPKIRRL
jgi:transposase InsO family protein